MSHKKNILPVPEPHYIPGYTGHCARLRDEIGNNYSMATHRVLVHPSSYDVSRSSESRAEVTDERNNTGDTAACRSYLQQAAEFIKNPSCQKLCCKRCFEEEDKCKIACFKGELQPIKTSPPTPKPTTCSYCYKQINAKHPRATNPTMVHQRAGKKCNKVNCKYSRSDEGAESKAGSKCPCFNTPDRTNSSTLELNDRSRKPVKDAQTVCERYGCPCPCCKLS